MPCLLSCLLFRRVALIADPRASGEEELGLGQHFCDAAGGGGVCIRRCPVPGSQAARSRASRRYSAGVLLTTGPRADVSLIHQRRSTRTIAAGTESAAPPTSGNSAKPMTSLRRTGAFRFRAGYFVLCQDYGERGEAVLHEGEGNRRRKCQVFEILFTCEGNVAVQVYTYSLTSAVQNLLFLCKSDAVLTGCASCAVNRQPQSALRNDM